MKKFANLSQEKPWNLQLFAEGGGDDGKDGADDGKDGGDGGTDPKTFTQEEVDELLKKDRAKHDAQFDAKIDKLFKKHQQELDEAKKLEQMTAEEKAQKEMEELKAKIDELQAANSKSEMMKSARSIFNEKTKREIPDALLEVIVTTEAESTKASIEAFADMFNAAVTEAVKKAMAGKTPEGKGDGNNNNTITKEEILKVADQRERQRLMAEHLDLFR